MNRCEIGKQVFTKISILGNDKKINVFQDLHSK